MSPSAKQSARDRMVIETPLLGQFPWLVHGFSTRRGGVRSFGNPDHSSAESADLNLGKVPWDRVENVLENRRRPPARLRAENMPLVILRQIHSDLICVLDGSGTPSPPPAGDGLITDRPGLLLAVLVADCLPILLVDARQRVVAALHCGWRGTARRLTEKAVGRMRLEYGSRTKDLWAAIGPGIRACCYQVGEEVVEEFASQFRYAEKLLATRTRPPSPLEIKHSVMLFTSARSASRREVFLDLVQANLGQLREAGVPAKHIASQAPCTSCHPELFFSHRRDAGRTGRMMGVIGIRKNR